LARVTYVCIATIVLASLFRLNAQITAPSRLSVNVGWVPFDVYDYQHSPSSISSALASACPGATSVRQCYRNIFANLKSQHVTGVRFFFGLCGGFYSTPLVGCGNSNYTLITGPPNTWTTNVQTFMSDLYEKDSQNRNIYNVIPTMVHGDQTVVKSGPPGPAPSGSFCAGTDSTVKYIPGEPFARHSVAPTAGNPNGVGAPIDDNHQGWNCSPSNPYFVGWQHTYDVWSTIIRAAYNTPTAGAKGMTIFELDVEQELNMTDFPVFARFVVDNTRADTGNPDSLQSLQYYMSYYGYDPGRITFSAQAQIITGLNPDGSNANCTDVYTDYARSIGMDAIISAIAGGWIGSPNGAQVQNGLRCGGTTSGMFQFPYAHTLPNIADMHTYACISYYDANGIVHCFGDDASAHVQTETQVTFDDLPHYFSLINTPSALFMLGETHSTSSDPANPAHTCETGAPSDSAQLTVYGYNASSYAGRSVVFQPWLNVPDSANCFRQAAQTINPPYIPSQY
jgi:hypothetical protein